MIDLKTIDNYLKQDVDGVKALLAEANVVLGATERDYHVSTHNDYLIIFGNAERTGSALLATATSIERQLPIAKVFLGKTNITYPEADRWEVDPGFPSYEEQERMRLAEPGIKIARDLATTIQDPTSRESSLCEIEVSETSDPKYYNLDEYIPKPTLHIGGPDRLIGYNEEKFQLATALRDDEKRLVLVHGEAGIGKSRLVAEVLKDLPHAIVTSLDAADKNVDGAGLVTLANQLSTSLSEDPFLGEDITRPDSSGDLTLSGFVKLPRPQQIDLALRDPKKLSQMCVDALVILNIQKSIKTPLVLEDLHHADEFSEKYLLAIAEKYAEETDHPYGDNRTGGKVVITMRPEEMYHSDAQAKAKKLFERYYGEDCVAEVNLKGLDFSDESISRDFAFYSLPKELRNGRQIGLWHTKLGKVAGHSPFVMKTLMDAILEDVDETAETIEGRYNNLEIKGSVIEVKPEILDRITRIGSDTDLAEFIGQRIEKLDPKGKKLMQAFALAGGKLTGNQIESISKDMLGLAMHTPEGQKVFSQLLLGGYISPDPNEEGTFTFQHEAMQQIAVNSFRDAEERNVIVRFLRTTFEKDPNTPADTTFSLLYSLAESDAAEVRQVSFWDNMAEASSASFKNAKDHNAIEKTHSIATKLFGNLMAKKREDVGGIKLLRIVARKVHDATGLGDIPRSLVRLTIETLANLAESATYLGRHEEAEKAMAILRKCEYAIETFEIQPEVLSSKRLVELEYLKAYAHASKENIELMRTIYDEQIHGNERFTPEEQVLALIQLEYREGRAAHAISTFNSNREDLETMNTLHEKANNGKPHPRYAEAFRITQLRAPIEMSMNVIKNRDGKTTLDDDISMQTGAIDNTDRTLDRQLVNVSVAFQTVREWEEKYPNVYDPYAKISNLEVEAELSSLLGKHEESIKLFGEAWRQSTKMGLHGQAARSAKRKGDRYIDMAFTCEDPQNRRFLIMRAIETYNREGLSSLDQLGEDRSFYHSAIRIQRARAISLLIDEYDLDEFDRIPMELKQGFAPYIQIALEDFKFVCDEMYNHPKQGGLTKSAEFSYYYMGYIQAIIDQAIQLGIDVPSDIYSQDQYPLMDTNVIGSAVGISYNKTDRGLSGGEVGRKRVKLIKLADILESIRESKMREREATARGAHEETTQ